VRLDGPPRLAQPVACPYLDGREFVQEYFFVDQVSAQETGSLLEAGWRHFGSFFFRPSCGVCTACEPLRIDVQRLKPTESQRRVLRKNADVELRRVPPVYKPEYFALYQEHSQERFQKDSDATDFEASFFYPAVPSFLTEYRLDGELAALGFCDESAVGLSSVYFVFSQKFASRSLGIYSVLRECQLAREMGLKWYFLGFYVRGNSAMAYKGRFFPRQILDWQSGEWNYRED
jgi:arginine-tRNA-protein transferase